MAHRSEYKAYSSSLYGSGSRHLRASGSRLAQMLSGYQFTPFEAGQIKAHLHHGLGASEIARIIFKSDGESRFSPTAVPRRVDVINADPR